MDIYCYWVGHYFYTFSLVKARSLYLRKYLLKMGRETEQFFFFLSKRMEWKVSVYIMCRKGKYCFMKILFYLHV